MIYIYYDPRQKLTASGADQTAYVWPGDTQDIFIQPDAFLLATTIDDIVQVLVHELEHINRGSSPDSEPDAQMAEIKCGFHIKVQNTIEVKPK